MARRRIEQFDDPNDDDGDWADDEYEPDEFAGDSDEPTEPCPFCRREIHEDAVRCPYCEQYISHEDARATRRPKSWLIVIGTIAALLIFWRWIVH